MDTATLLFREVNELPFWGSPENFGQQKLERPRSNDILCRACYGKVTTKKDRFVKDGQSEHCFFNPNGIAFVINCFLRAHCRASGEASREFSWFRGYSWRVALCAHCQEHLGWLFESLEGESFFGLIVEKLVEKG